MESSGTEKNDGWLVALGERGGALEQLAHAAVMDRVAQGAFRLEDVEYVRRLKMPLIEGDLAISDRQLELLRRLCQLAEVDLVPSKISSHRRFVGPVIVGAKKVLFSILKVLLKDTLRKQRDFNAGVISFLAESTKLDNRGPAVHHRDVEQA